MEQLSDFLTHFISSYGLVAVFVLMVLESALIPLPSEITMTFAGFLSGVGVFDFWTCVFVGTTGNLIGSLITYNVGKSLGEKNIKRMVRTWGRWVFFRQKEYEISMKWFKKYGQGVVLASRLIPGFRALISLPAGISGMNIWIFGVFIFLGSFVWSLILAYVGLKLGENWRVISPFLESFRVLVIVSFSVLLVWYFYKRIKRK